MTPRFAIPGSEPHHPAGGSWLPVGADHVGVDQISPTIIIRRPPKAGDVSQQLLSGSWHQPTRAEAENLLRVDPADLAAVLTFVRNYGLTVISQNAEARTVRVEGTTGQVGEAFGVEIEWRVDPDGQKYLSYQGSITLPGELKGIVEAVVGLDQRKIARHGAGA